MKEAKFRYLASDWLSEVVIFRYFDDVHVRAVVVWVQWLCEGRKEKGLSMLLPAATGSVCLHTVVWLTALWRFFKGCMYTFTVRSWLQLKHIMKGLKHIMKECFGNRRDILCLPNWITSQRETLKQIVLEISKKFN